MLLSENKKIDINESKWITTDNWSEVKTTIRFNHADKTKSRFTKIEIEFPESHHLPDISIKNNKINIEWFGQYERDFWANVAAIYLSSYIKSQNNFK